MITPRGNSDTLWLIKPGILSVRLVLTLSCLLGLFSSVNAQRPVVCPTDEVAEMTPFCNQACVICDIDGFSGRNGRDLSYELPSDFCTLQQHNGKWIGFVAGSEDLTVRLNISNCENNDGLEIAIYEGIDCENFRVVSNCFGGFGRILPGSSGTFSNLEPLVIGQYYYLVMDGARNDVCDWRFTVVSGTTELAALETTGPIFGPRTVCPDVPNMFTITEQTGATEYLWTVDGLPVGREGVLNHSFPTTGLAEVCVQAVNACDEASSTCTSVTIRSIPLQTIDTVLCARDSIVFADTVLTTGGRYTFDFVTPTGCDSNFVLNVTEVPSTLQEISAAICAGDTLKLNGQEYTTEDLYEQVLINQFGCDSTLRLSLRVIECNILANGRGRGVQCAGGSSGEYSFEVTNGTPPFTYTFGPVGATPAVTGDISELNETVQINNLSAGVYQSIILDEFGNDTRILNVVIEEPEPLTISAATPDFGGFGVSCNGSADGAAALTALGGVPPYAYRWADGETGSVRGNLPSGSYAYAAMDGNGCSTEGELLLAEPTALTAVFDFTDPSCDGPATGSVSVLDAVGGVPPYRLVVGEQINDTFPSTISRLPEGNFTVQLVDANGCIFEESLDLVAAVIPEISIPASLTVKLGERFFISPTATNGNGLSLAPSTGLLPVDSFPPRYGFQARDDGSINVTVISDDGCVTVDSVQVTVVKDRLIYAPTAFSPNADGVNDVFRLGLSSGVAEVSRLTIFDRWGGLLYDSTSDTEGTTGWRGSESPVGTYIWTAEVLYLDGFREVRSGGVALLR